LEELQAEHRDLRSQILEQSAGLKRVEGRLEMMEQAAARYMLQQQELLKEQRDVGIRLEEMKSAGRKTNIIAFVAIGLLVFSILLNVAVFIYFLHLRP
jgi:predicted nuclease with TOPRIM domain